MTNVEISRIDKVAGDSQNWGALISGTLQPGNQKWPTKCDSDFSSDYQMEPVLNKTHSVNSQDAVTPMNNQKPHYNQADDQIPAGDQLGMQKISNQIKPHEWDEVLGKGFGKEINEEFIQKIGRQVIDQIRDQIMEKNNLTEASSLNTGSYYGEVLNKPSPIPEMMDSFGEGNIQMPGIHKTVSEQNINFRVSQYVTDGQAQAITSGISPKEGTGVNNFQRAPAQGRANENLTAGPFVGQHAPGDRVNSPPTNVKAGILFRKANIFR